MRDLSRVQLGSPGSAMREQEISSLSRRNHNRRRRSGREERLESTIVRHEGRVESRSIFSS